MQFSKVPVEWQYKSDGRISDGNTLTHECTLRLGGMETFTEKGNFKIILVRLTSTLCPRNCAININITSAMSYKNMK